MGVARLAPGLLFGTAALLALSACSSFSSAATSQVTETPRGATVSVVASTNVYGDIAATIGGNAVTVTSIISDPSADPHSYEANAQTELALSKADVVIENGGGYDDFVDTMLHASGNTSTAVLNAVDISGKAATGGAQPNEHVWYDFPTVAAVADKIAAALTRAAPRDADTFTANATAFKGELATLEQTERNLAAHHSGAGVAITEPVPLYLLQGAGLENRTPTEFSQAIEEETDVPPAVMQEMIALFTNHQVAALVYNVQTPGPQTQQVLQAAKDNGIGIVPVTETLPAGQTYISWMTANLTALSTALSK